jgi:hypothetical protein
MLHSLQLAIATSSSPYPSIVLATPAGSYQGIDSLMPQALYQSIASATSRVLYQGIALAMPKKPLLRAPLGASTPAPKGEANGPIICHSPSASSQRRLTTARRLSAGGSEKKPRRVGTPEKSPAAPCKSRPSGRRNPEREVGALAPVARTDAAHPCCGNFYPILAPRPSLLTNTIGSTTHLTAPTGGSTFVIPWQQFRPGFEGPND